MFAVQRYTKNYFEQYRDHFFTIISPLQREITRRQKKRHIGYLCNAHPPTYLGKLAKLVTLNCAVI